MTKTLQIFSARWVVPVVPQNTVLEHHSVVVESGMIIDILPTNELPSEYTAAATHKLETHALIPGLVNAHTHAAMNLFRGMADDLPLMTWLQEHMWPAEAKWVGEEFMKDGTELAVAEMLLGGTTCFNDMYFYPDVVAKTAQGLGIRAFVGIIVMDFPNAWAATHEEHFEKGLAMHDEVRALSRIGTTMAPHAPYTVSDAPLERVRTYADELHIPIHMHIHETENEVSESVAETGLRPLERLYDLGLLNPRMMAVHMTQLNDAEISLTAQQGLSVVHCPESNLKLASGACRVADLLSAGTNVCLGTDSAASNNDLDMIGEMRTAALLGKLTASNATALPAWQCLEMATINGAKALNVQDKIGSLEKGKSADMVAIDLNQPSTQPVYDPISQIVYSVNRNHISDVWVEGQARVRNHRLVDIDTPKLIEKSAIWGERISGSTPRNTKSTST